MALIAPQNAGPVNPAFTLEVFNQLGGRFFMISVLLKTLPSRASCAFTHCAILRMPSSNESLGFLIQ
jgi:hypothetical protein